MEPISLKKQAIILNFISEAVGHGVMDVNRARNILADRRFGFRDGVQINRFLEIAQSRAAREEEANRLEQQLQQAAHQAWYEAVDADYEEGCYEVQ